MEGEWDIPDLRLYCCQKGQFHPDSSDTLLLPSPLRGGEQGKLGLSLRVLVTFLPAHSIV